MIGFYSGLALLSGLLHAMSALCLKHALMHDPAQQTEVSRSFILLSSLCGLPVVLWQIGNLPYRCLWQPIFAGALFYLALRFINLAIAKGAASLVVPVLGSKVLFAALLAALMLGRSITLTLLMAGGLIFTGIFLLTRGGEKQAHILTISWQSRAAVIVLALAATALLALVDTLIVYFRDDWGLYTFLSMLFLVTGACALVEDRRRSPFKKLTDLFREPKPMLWSAALLNILQTLGLAIAIYYSTRVAEMNVLYASRSLWVVVIGYALSRFAQFGEGDLHGRVLWLRLLGALSICCAITILCA
ncbi:EamA family transporter [Cerasicoccus maritimus]|uniref:EamA family transporter n=1 Tax=Cerasicoccus maritimus TaxID=490089 RepID=UPI0028525334|nr:EamA family transporter [Cerasicoccus maritimus]